MPSFKSECLFLNKILNLPTSNLYFLISSKAILNYKTLNFKKTLMIEIALNSIDNNFIQIIIFLFKSNIDKTHYKQTKSSRKSKYFLLGEYNLLNIIVLYIGLSIFYFMKIYSKIKLNNSLYERIINYAKQIIIFTINHKNNQYRDILSFIIRKVSFFVENLFITYFTQVNNKTNDFYNSCPKFDFDNIENIFCTDKPPFYTEIIETIDFNNYLDLNLTIYNFIKELNAKIIGIIQKMNPKYLIHIKTIPFNSLQSINARKLSSKFFDLKVRNANHSTFENLILQNIDKSVFDIFNSSHSEESYSINSDISLNKAFDYFIIFDWKKTMLYKNIIYKPWIENEKSNHFYFDCLNNFFKIDKNNSNRHLLNDCIVYVKNEPCTLCGMSILHSRVKYLFFDFYSENGAIKNNFFINCTLYNGKKFNHNFKCIKIFKNIENNLEL